MSLDALTLDERVALLEQRVGLITPRALTPPITIGEMTNVPAPGSQIAAQWAQDASERVVHRYASKAALDGWTSAPNGTLAVALDTNVVWQRRGNAWSQFTPWRATANVPGNADTAGINGSQIHLTLNVPADPAIRIYNAHCHIMVYRYTLYPSEWELLIAGVVQSRFDFSPENDPSPTGGYSLPRLVSLSATGELAPNTVATVAVRGTGHIGGAYTIPGAQMYSRLDVLVVPRAP